MSLICNRLAITGSVSERTPIIVLQEIAIAHGINYNPPERINSDYVRALVKTIYNTPVVRINKPLRVNSKALAIRYLGASDEDWTLEELERIFDQWEAVINSSNYDVQIEHFGPVTKNCPFSLNACFLYRICKNKGLKIPFDVTLEGLVSVVKFSSESINNAIELINTMLLRGNPDEILPLLGLIPNNYLESRLPNRSSTQGPSVVTYESLSNLLASRNFSSSELRRKHNPSNNCEAIALACYLYGINLFFALNPVKEYYAIRLSGLSRYVPTDPGMSQIYSLNENLIHTRVFEPRIPLPFYSESTLWTTLENEGYPRSASRESAYESLQLAYLSETFHQGKFPNLANSETPFLEEQISDLDSRDVICFGCMTNPLTALNLREILMSFRRTGNFNNFITGGDVFSETAIRKLRLICRNLATPEAIECIRELDSIESLLSTSSSILNIFASRYTETTQEQKAIIRNVLTDLFKLSMYMRGWNGITDYPIIDTDVDNQHLVDVRVTQSVIAFETSVELSDYSALIRSLPLIKYSSGRFEVSSNVEYGLTLGQRVSLMKSGEYSNNVNSCIRLSSNWLAASCYRYHQVIKVEVPFEIENLRWIS